MFGFVAGGSPPPTRWGNGSDGDAVWSSTSTQTGIKQYKTLTISDNALVKIGTTGLLENGLVVFANREIIIGDNVELTAQPNSDSYRESTSWKAAGADNTDVYGWNGGGGGGTYGTNCCGNGADDGNDPAFYYTTGLATSYGTLIADAGGAASQGANYCNRSGGDGSAGASAQSSWITDNFGFTLDTVSGRDNFPVVHGGDGGNGGRTSSCGESVTEGYGGTGGGMILLIAPKITFGSSVLLNAYGCTRDEGGGVDGAANKNMSGNRNGDGGSGAGGAGGGGLVAVVYDTKVGSYTADASGGIGGLSPAGGNRGGAGGNGGDGVTLDGQRGYMAGDITWS